MRLALFVFALAAACTPASPPRASRGPLSGPGFAAVDHPHGLAWSTGGPTPLEVVLVDTSDPRLAPGLYVRCGALDLSFGGWMDWRDRQGRFPLLLTGPPASGAPALEVGETLLLELVGSTEHGCTDPTLLVEVAATDGGGVSLAVSGVPYLALPPAGVARIDGQRVSLSQPPLDDLRDVQSVVVQGGPLPALSWTSLEPVPLLQLQDRGGFVEVDLDRSCTAPGWVGATLSVTPAESGRAG